MNEYGIDAQKWARGFLAACEIAKTNSGFDEGFVIGWFANAIMAGYDRGSHDAKSSDLTCVHADGWNRKEWGAWK